MTTIYKGKAVFTKNGQGASPSSAPTCTIVDTSNNILVSAQPAPALSNMSGAYLYSYSGADGLDVIFLFHTSDATVDRQDLYSYTSDVLLSISSRLPSALTSNGNMKSSLSEIITTALGEGAVGRIAAAFQTMFNVANSVFTTASANQTGDNYARLGAPSGASVSADIATLAGYVDTEVAAIKAKTDNLPASPAAVGSQMDFVNAPNSTAISAIQSGLATPADVAVSVTLTSTQAAALNSGSIAVIAGDSFSQNFNSTSMADLASASKFWVTAKENSGVSDANGYFFIEKTAGLTRLNGADYATPADASIVVTGSAGAWVITVAIKPAATSGLFDINNTSVLFTCKYLLGTTETTLFTDGVHPTAGKGQSRIVNGGVRAIS